MLNWKVELTLEASYCAHLIKDFQLTDLLRRVSRHKHGPDKAEQVRQAAADSVGMRRGLDGARIAIRTLLDSLKAKRTEVRELQRAENP